MSPFQDSPQRAKLAAALKRLRLASDLTGYQLAEQLGLDQSTVSRIERNRQRISIPQVEAWCTAAGASETRRRELLALAEEALVGPTSWEEAGETGSTNFQRETQQVEAKARLMSFYQPAMLPGLLQTVTYARRVFSSGPAGEPPDLAARVMGRMERQRILYDDQKQLRFVIPEAVLRWPVGPYEEQIEQLDRLVEIMARPNVDVRIIPLAPTTAWRATGFVLFEELGDEPPFVHLELLTRPVNVDEPTQIEFYREVFRNLQNAAVADDEAVCYVERVAAQLRAAGSGRPTE